MAKKKKTKPNLPDHLIYAKKGTRKNAAPGHQKKFFKELKEEDINPNGKEDFDKVLKGILELKNEKPLEE